MPASPQFSIIIPCYNSQKHISETIQSLKNQSFKDYEVLCIDDGSNDDTLDSLCLLRNDKTINIRIFSHENQGVSYTRNKGITMARGKYILFLDSDDVINSNLLDLINEKLMIKDFDTIFFRFTRNLDKALYYDLNSSTFINEISQNEAMSKLLYEMGKYSFACFVYKKELLDKYSIFFDERTKHFEDREFNWKYLCHCKTFCWINAPLYGYRINQESVTNNSGSQWNDDGIKAVIRIEDYLKKRECLYSEKIQNYLLPRVLWSKAKSFSMAGNKSSLKRLEDEYDLKNKLKKLIGDRSIVVSISSFIYVISRSCFYFLFFCLGKIRNACSS